MTTQTESIADILRGLAESGDQRFEALRCDHPQRQGGIDGLDCLDCREMIIPIAHESWSEFGIKTDLGSIVRAAAACGLFVSQMYLHNEGSWDCDFQDAVDGTHYLKYGPTPEFAAAKAFREAVK